jgi:hypothetical protein
LISSCNVDVTHFPFDEQTCKITLMSWGTMTNEIVLNSPLSTLKLDFYSKHGTWDVSSTSSLDNKGTGMSYIELSTTMKRRPAFYVVNIVLPVMFLMALNSCFCFAFKIGRKGVIFYHSIIGDCSVHDPNRR